MAELPGGVRLAWGRRLRALHGHGVTAARIDAFVSTGRELPMGPTAPDRQPAAGRCERNDLGVDAGPT
jgi:hypothetical protein